MLLVILSGGGFTFETRTLLGHLREQAQFTYLRTQYGGMPGRDAIPTGDARDVPSFSTVMRKSLSTSVYAFTKTFIVALSVILSRRIDAIVAVGCSHTIPMLLAGRLTGRRNVFIETITRTDRLSNTGKIVYYLHLSDQFFVQWPNMRARYPCSIGGSDPGYRGHHHAVDELLEEVDHLAGSGFFAEDIVCQSGQSTYVMAHCKQFVGMEIGQFAQLITESSMVISHGGATVIQLLLARKPFVAFPNPRGAGDHQASFLRQIATVADISWSPNVTDLADLIRERQTKGSADVHLDFPRIHAEIIRSFC